MRNWFYLIACLLSFSICPLKAEIIEARTLEPIEKALQTIDEHTLVAFDVDAVIIVPQDTILRPKAEALFSRFYAEIIKNSALEQPEKFSVPHLTSVIFSNGAYGMVEPAIAPLIQGLMQKGHKVIALTKMRTGPYGLIPSMEDWRVNELRSIGIDFSETFKAHPYIKLSHMERNGRWPIFKEGILCADQWEKGPVLMHFLDAIDYRPKKVIFIDDLIENHHSLEMWLNAAEIEFLGFHYTYLEHESLDIDHQLAEFQMKHLFTHGVWLKDADALEKMKGQ